MRQNYLRYEEGNKPNDLTAMSKVLSTSLRSSDRRRRVPPFPAITPLSCQACPAAPGSSLTCRQASAARRPGSLLQACTFLHNSPLRGLSFKTLWSPASVKRTHATFKLCYPLPPGPEKLENWAALWVGRGPVVPSLTHYASTTLHIQVNS